MCIENLPAELVRIIFNFILNDDPGYILNFTDEYFKLAQYSLIEKETLITTSFYRMYALEKVPLLEKEKFYNSDYVNFIYLIEPMFSFIFFQHSSIIKFCKNGNLDRLKFIKLTFNEKFTHDEFFEISSRFNKFETFKWLFEQKYDNYIPRFLDNYSYNAIFNNNLEMLKWMYPDNDNYFPLQDLYSKFYCIVMHGNFEMLKWLHEKVPAYKNYKYISCEDIILHNNFEMVKWMKSLNPPYALNKSCCKNACINNNFEMLKWLRSSRKKGIFKIFYRGCPWDIKLCLDVCTNEEMKTWIKSHRLQLLFSPLMNEEYIYL